MPIVITGNDFFYHLDKDKYIPEKAMALAKVDKGQLWPFPAKLFSLKNVPFVIVILYDKNNKKPLTITTEDLEKCK